MCRALKKGHVYIMWLYTYTTYIYFNLRRWVSGPFLVGEMVKGWIEVTDFILLKIHIYSHSHRDWQSSKTEFCLRRYHPRGSNKETELWDPLILRLSRRTLEWLSVTFTLSDSTTCHHTWLSHIGGYYYKIFHTSFIRTPWFSRLL